MINNLLKFRSPLLIRLGSLKVLALCRNEGPTLVLSGRMRRWKANVRNPNWSSLRNIAQLMMSSLYLHLSICLSLTRALSHSFSFPFCLPLSIPLILWFLRGEILNLKMALNCKSINYKFIKFILWFIE